MAEGRNMLIMLDDTYQVRVLLWKCMPDQGLP